MCAAVHSCWGYEITLHGHEQMKRYNVICAHNNILPGRKKARLSHLWKKMTRTESSSSRLSQTLRILYHMWNPDYANRDT